MEIRNIVNKSKGKLAKLGVIDFKRQFYISFTEKDPTSRILGVCYRGWLGIGNATKINFDNVLELDDIYEDEYVQDIVGEVMTKGYEKIIFNGLSVGMERVIHALSEKGLYVEMIYHGSPAQFVSGSYELDSFDKIVELYRSKKIRRIGVVKRDFEKLLEMLEISSFYLPNRSPNLSLKGFDSKKFDKDMPVFGIFTQNLGWVKNSYNQILAALTIPNSRIYVNFEVNDLPVLKDFEDRFVNVGIVKDQKKFMEIISKTDINLYVTMTECYPMHVVYCTALGIPCLVANTSGIFYGNDILKNSLTVHEHESAYAISQKLSEVVLNYDSVKNSLRNYNQTLAKESDSKWRGYFEFLRAQ